MNKIINILQKVYVNFWLQLYISSFQKSVLYEE